MSTSQAAEILITGATGFLGARLAEMLLEQDARLRLLVRDAAKLRAPLRANCEVITGSLAQPEMLARAVKNIRWVYHCAANVNTWDTPGAYEAANVTGVRHLLDAIEGHGSQVEKLVHVSTVDVYGFPDAPCDEQCEPHPPGYGYGDTKLIGEQLVRAHAQRTGLPFTIIRPANIFGPHGQFVDRLGQDLRNGLMLTIDHGRCNAGLVYVDNLVRYMIWAARSPRAAGEVYNVRDTYDVDWHTYVHGLRQAIGGRGLLLNLPFALADRLARANAAVHRRLHLPGEPLIHPLLIRILGKTCGHSAAKIRTHSQLQDLVDFETAMRRSVDWFLDRYPARS